MNQVPNEIVQLIGRLGMKRSQLTAGDEVIGLGFHMISGGRSRHFLIHGRIEALEGENATVRVIRDYYFDDTSYPRNEMISVDKADLLKSFSELVEEHMEFFKWLSSSWTS